MSDREPLIGLFGEASDGGGQSPNFILNSLLVHKRLLNAAVHCVHHQLRRARRLLNRVLLRLLSDFAESEGGFKRKIERNQIE